MLLEILEIHFQPLCLSIVNKKSSMSIGMQKKYNTILVIGRFKKKKNTFISNRL